jgi:transcriptional regulator with XRE-family HTH domain
MHAHSGETPATQVREKAPVIRLKVDALRARLAKLGVRTDASLAERLGMSRSGMYRVMNGLVLPGEKFIAALLFTFTKLRFEQVFEVVLPEEENGDGTGLTGPREAALAA